MENNLKIKKPCLKLGFLFLITFLGFNVSLIWADSGNLKISGKTEKTKSKAKKTKKVELRINEVETTSSKISKGKASKNSEASYRSMSEKAIRNQLMMDKPYWQFNESDKKRIRRELEVLRDRKTTQQFLTIIQIAEAGGPNIMVGDKPGCRVNNLKKHPAEVLSSRCYYYYYDKKGNLKVSTASGNYQLTLSNYKKLAPFLDITDFSVDSQQLLALELIRRGGRKPEQVRKGVVDLYRGDVRGAVRKATPDWAAIPGSDLQGRKYEKFKQMSESVINGKIPFKSKSQTLLSSKNGKIYYKYNKETAQKKKKDK